MAELAPSEVVANLPLRTLAANEAKDPKTPEAKYRAKKSPRPISSWTGAITSS